jgi:outer membrane protein OmpA-like peptidoglycan-associated protein
MKTVFKLLFFAMFFMGTPQASQAQFLKKLVKHAQDKINSEAERRANRRVDKGIDKTLDKTEDAIDGKTKKSDKSTASSSKADSKEQSSHEDNKKAAASKATQPKLVWSKYDFVPGDTVIFEDGPSADEENGEFPSRWDLHQGGAEIAEVDGVPVITFITASGNMHSKGIVPYLKNPEQDYLPEIFTIEFDAYFEPEVYNWRYYVSFNDRKNQEYFRGGQLTIYVNSMRMAESEGELKDKSRGNRDEEGGWRHISIAYTKGKFKAYLQDQRLINIPHLEGNPTGITLSGDEEGMYVKNFRIAKGGVKYYDKVITDGKIIVNGIKFDVNKATLKPESMGPINRIYKLMQKNPDLKFSVEGHTDSDGDEAFNLALSKKRGKAVMEKLVSMGIDQSRLKYTGWGESKPIDNNTTPEGKANNRRVEFVKF